MANKQPPRNEEPIFSIIVDRVIEVTAKAESNLDKWTPSTLRSQQPAALFSVVVDQLIEITEPAVAPPPEGEAHQEQKGKEKRDERQSGQAEDSQQQ
jgi:hypothetical protein